MSSDLRFRAAICEPETPSFCGISGDLAPSTWKSLAIAIARDFVFEFISKSYTYSCTSIFELYMYHLSPNYYIAAPQFWTTNLGHRNVNLTSQKLSWNYFLDAVILTGD